MLPCNKKGKIAGKKKGFLQSDDYENAVEIRVNSSNELSIRLYFIARFGESINQMANELFDGIEADLELYGINKPVFITANVKGVLAKQIVERNVEVSRYNG